MQKEYETKVLDIDKEEVEKQLLNLGAEKVDTVHLRRWMFDLTDYSVPEEDKIVRFIRLRDNGHKITLTYKSKTFRGIGTTEEVETEVMDFEEMFSILSRIPFVKVLYQENKRTIFRLDGIEFSIDEWPMLKPHLEVESFSLEKVKEGLRMLGLGHKDVGDMDIVEIYKNEIGVSMNDIKELRFDK